jgi:demethylmenaquinone methyltransferase/2-methoxy-6-polyprenyl-1,4-benzoquinol methylase
MDDVMETPLDKRGATIRDMFAGVAPRYDFLNHLLSASLDVVWRKRSASALDLAPGSAVIDLCCGTGEQALALARRGYRVLASDFCLPMLALAQPKYRRLRQPPRGFAADALATPFADRVFDGATVSFGLRNVADLDRALGEIHRLLRPGGEVAVLEFAVPENAVLRALYLFYFRRVLPLVGRLFSPRGSAYSYLPSSVLEFPQRQGFLDRLSAAGFAEPRWRDLTAGIVCLYTARRPA